MNTPSHADYTIANTDRAEGLEDFTATLLHAALTFLRRHQGEHLTSDDLLFCRTVSYLVSGFGISRHSAEKLVGQAYDDLKTTADGQHLVLAGCSESTAMVADPETGLTWAIPVALIYERIIYAQDDQRLQLVTP